MTGQAVRRSVAIFGVVLLGAGCTHPAADESATDGSAADGSADGDHDYLTDDEEAALGTDAANPDTDGDGYLDGDEVLEGTSPLDAASRIYEGGWPYQRFKDAIVDPGYDTPPTVGQAVPRLVATDQFGELVDLYDFAGHDRPIVLDLSAGWCGACKAMAAWLDGEPSTFLVPEGLEEIPALVAAGTIYWVTIYFQDGASQPADAADVATWYETFPNPRVPVLADTDQAMFTWLWPGSYPNVQAVNDDMTLRTYDRFDYVPALEAVLP